jgi:urease accessory protein
MLVRLTRRATVAATLCLVAAGPASAHHFMGGKIPATFSEGFLSGLGHPVIGPDHLAFLVAVGIIAGLYRVSVLVPALFVLAMAIGVLVHVVGMTLPASEIVVALSVMFAGATIALGELGSTAGLAALFALAGLFHGYAFGESIYGAERSPLGAYLLGLVLIQSTIVIAIAMLTRRMNARGFEMATRIAGVAILGIGFAALVAQLVPGA